MANATTILSCVPRHSRVFYFYYRKTMLELEKKHWKKTNKIYFPYVVTFVSNIDFCHDAFMLLKKAFMRIGWTLTLGSYTFTKETGGTYTFMVTKTDEGFDAEK